MTTSTRGPAAAGAVLLSALLAVTVAGCAPDAATGTARTTNEKLTQGVPSATADPGAGSTASSSDASEDPDGPDSSDTPDPSLSGQPVPTLPSGDPGTGTPAPGGHASAHPVTAVPASALLDIETVGAVAGGDWVAAAAPAGWCASPRTPGAAVSRGQLLSSADGRLVQTVSAYSEPRQAVRAVATATTKLQSCGFTVVRDPRLGEASELLTRTGAGGADETAVVLAAEGVGVVLLASGTPVAPDVWDSLVDLALGSSCAAAAEGCH